MAVVYLTGAEAGEAALDGITLGGTAPAAYSTAQARTGTRSLRLNLPTGTSGYARNPAASVTGWIHFGLYVATLPTGGQSRGLVTLGTNVANLSATGQITAFGGGFSTVALTTGRWYWIGLRAVAGSFTGSWIQIDGVDVCTRPNTGPTAGIMYLGANDVLPGSFDIYYDDVVVDDTGFLAASKVIDLLPTADSAIGTGWTLGSGGTTNLFGGVDNQPPTAVADPGTTAQIRNAASAVSNYDATLQTYTVGGATSGATVLAVQPVVSTAAPVTTSAKLGTVGNVSNPAITNIALGAGGTAGAFWSGVAAGTYPTGWKVSQGTLTTSPSVTLGTAPVMRVTQSTASTRIAMVGYMALRVAWTPSAATPVTGTGAGAGTAATSAGTAAETMSGTGAGTGTAATASGSGTSLQSFTGTGAGTQAAQTASGTGVETITGTGAGTPPPASSAGSGTSLLAATGTGAGSQAVQTAAGSGSSLLAATGTGAGVQAAASASGSGDVAALGDITGTGAGVQASQSGDGVGTVEGGVEIPPTIEGSTIFAPKLRVISGGGGGVQVRQTAKGRGTVNDDDLVVMAA